jgi:hypothetical protein
VLANLEREELSRDGRPKLARRLRADAGDDAASPPAQLGLFAAEEDPVVRALREISIETLSPLEALNVLADLKKRTLE